MLGAVLMALVGFFGVSQHSGAAENPPQIVLETSTGKHPVNVEWATTVEQRTQGLMFREKMAEDAGMIFDFGGEQPLVFWMKNTILSLDMVFIHQDGTVYRIEQRTEPYSERNIPSGAPVRYVLEVNAGTAKRIGLKPGDKVRLN